MVCLGALESWHWDGVEAVWLAWVVGVWLAHGPGSRVGVAWMGEAVRQVGGGFI